MRLFCPLGAKSPLSSFAYIVKTSVVHQVSHDWTLAFSLNIFSSPSSRRFFCCSPKAKEHPRKEVQWSVNTELQGVAEKREEIVVNSFHFPISRKNVRWSPILHYRIMVGCTVSVTWNAICKEDTFFRVFKTLLVLTVLWLECCLPLKSLLMQMYFIPRWLKVAQGWSHYFHPTKTSTRSDCAINSGFGLDVKRIQGIRISFR